MENIVKIHYSGKDYIGQIVSIESEWDCLRMIGKPETERTLLYYKISMYEKDTGCLIDNIFAYIVNLNHITNNCRIIYKVDKISVSFLISCVSLSISSFGIR